MPKLFLPVSENCDPFAVLPINEAAGGEPLSYSVNERENARHEKSS